MVSDDHTNRDCLAIVVMTHGEEEMIYARDDKFPADDIIDKFRGNFCTTLAGKPKLFFIEACRGKENNFTTVMSKLDNPAAPCGISLPR